MGVGLAWPAAAQNCIPLTEGLSLKDAGAKGGCYVLPRGKYGGTVEVKKDLELRGAGALSTRISIRRGNKAALSVTSGVRLKLSDMSVLHHGSAGDAIRLEPNAKLVLQRAVVSAGGGAAIQIDGGRATIRHCIIESSQAGIRTTSRSSLKVTVENTLFQGIRNKAVDAPRSLRPKVKIKHCAFYRNGINPSGEVGVIGLDPRLNNRYLPMEDSPLYGAGTVQNHVASTIGIYPRGKKKRVNPARAWDGVIARVNEAMKICQAGESFQRENQWETAMTELRRGIDMFPPDEMIARAKKIVASEEAYRVLAEASSARSRCVEALALVRIDNELAQGRPPEAVAQSVEAASGVTASKQIARRLERAIRKIPTQIRLEPCEPGDIEEKPVVDRVALRGTRRVVAELQRCLKSPRCETQSIHTWHKELATVVDVIERYETACAEVRKFRQIAKKEILLVSSKTAQKAIAGHCAEISTDIELLEPIRSRCVELERLIDAWSLYAEGLEQMATGDPNKALSIMKRVTDSGIASVVDLARSATQLLVQVLTQIDRVQQELDEMKKVEAKHIDDRSVTRVKSLRTQILETRRELKDFDRKNTETVFDAQLARAKDRLDTLGQERVTLVETMCRHIASEVRDLVIEENFEDAQKRLALGDRLRMSGDTSKSLGAEFKRLSAQISEKKAEAEKERRAYQSTLILAMLGLLGLVVLALVVGYWVWRRRYHVLVTIYARRGKRGVDDWNRYTQDQHVPWWIRWLQIDVYRVYGKLLFHHFADREQADEPAHKLQKWLWEEIRSVIPLGNTEPRHIERWTPLLNKVRQDQKAPVEVQISLVEHLLTALEEVDSPPEDPEFWSAVLGVTVKTPGELARLLQGDAHVWRSDFHRAFETYHELTGKPTAALGPAIMRLERIASDADNMSQAVSGLLRFFTTSLSLKRPEGAGCVWQSDDSNLPYQEQSNRVVVDITHFECDTTIKIDALVESATQISRGCNASYVMIFGRLWNERLQRLCKGLQKSGLTVLPLTVPGMVRVIRQHALDKVLDDYLRNRRPVFFVPPTPVEGLADYYDRADHLAWISNHLVNGGGAPFPLLVGLRKTGKTSLVNHWLYPRTYLSAFKHMVCVYIDLLRRPGSVRDARNWLPYRVYHEVQMATNMNPVWQWIWQSRPPMEPPRPQLYNAEKVEEDTQKTVDWLYAFAKQPGLGKVRFLFFIDEAFDDFETDGKIARNESDQLELVPKSSDSPPWESFRTLVPLLTNVSEREKGRVSGATQHRPQVQICLLAHNDCPARAELIRQPGTSEPQVNKLHSLLEPEFIQPMASEDMTQMLHALIALDPAFPEISVKEIDRTIKRAGGHPYLARAVLARDFAGSMSSTMEECARVAIDDLFRELWRRDLTDAQKAVLRNLASSPGSSAPPAKLDIGNDLKSLVRLGVLDPSERIRCEVFKEWIEHREKSSRATS